MTLPGKSTIFFRKTVGDITVPSWQTKMLVWTMPLLFVLTGFVLLASSFIWVNSATKTAGTVVTVNEYTDSFSGNKIYLPTFSYTWTDGTQVQANLTAPHPALIFEIGDTHTILFNPNRHETIRLPDFASHYMIGLVVVAIGVMFMVISLMLWVAVKSIARKQDKQLEASS